jgi:hypothetical protein
MEYGLFNKLRACEVAFKSLNKLRRLDQQFEKATALFETTLYPSAPAQ